MSVVGVCPRALVPASSCAEEVTRHNPVVEEDLGESSEDRQQLFLRVDSKGGAANWRHICATCGNGG